jgi:hypothetical protein
MALIAIPVPAVFRSIREGQATGIGEAVHEMSDKAGGEIERANGVSTVDGGSNEFLRLIEGKTKRALRHGNALSFSPERLNYFAVILLFYFPNLTESKIALNVLSYFS